MFIVLVFVIIIYPTVSKTDEIAALILARGGSKGVYLKNLQTVGGVSLLARTVHTARAAGLVDVTVSTDHPLIALEALKCGAHIFHRSRVTSSNVAPSIWGSLEFLDKNPGVRTLILLQATSPFTRASQIRLAVDAIKTNRFDCVFSVTRTFHLRWKENKKFVSPINFDLQFRPRRQSWRGELVETGAFYVARRSLLEAGYFQNHNCTVVEMSRLESLEIDSYWDLKLANVLCNSNLV
ncbi:N-acylneuraminate cytidylyltransferase [Plutella xylostella]|uniref:N-acylneuraminate cytidylyltransferase n=1 Tax=Plutella xylostella TaxID=51655 RepID=UPI0020328F70|nr:N-acylneuraminate cytidylyltransferase [Plutella xylostella]